MDHDANPAAGDDDVAPPAGSDFYYATLYLETAARQALHVVEACRRELATIPQTCSDRGVAHLKLAWWHDEFARLAHAEPRHPLTRLLRPVVVRRPSLGTAFSDLVAALAAGLADPVFADRAAVLEAIGATHGRLFEAAMELTAGGRGPAPPPARLVVLACRTELACELNAFSRHRRGGPLYVPGDVLRRHALTVDAVRTVRAGGAVEGMLADELSDLAASIDDDLRALPARVRRRHACTVTLARITRHALHLTLADGCRVLERQVPVLPIHKLAIAWRTARFG